MLGSEVYVSYQPAVDLVYGIKHARKRKERCDYSNRPVSEVIQY